ncbi:hypothetical protein OC835_007880 [Tilletia horrida]|nr:hypothetical protein OC835_007880 [Tilletia horrida]
MNYPLPITLNTTPQVVSYGPLHSPHVTGYNSGFATIATVDALNSPAPMQVPPSQSLQELFSAHDPFWRLLDGCSTAAAPPQTSDPDSSMDTLVEEEDEKDSGAGEEDTEENGGTDDSAMLTAKAPAQAKAFLPVVRALQKHREGLTPSVFVKVVKLAFAEPTSPEQKKLQDEWRQQLGHSPSISSYIKAISPWVCIEDVTSDRIVLVRLRDVDNPYHTTQQPVRIWNASFSKIVLEPSRKRKRQMFSS